MDNATTTVAAETVKLGKTTYTVTRKSENWLILTGPRGGRVDGMRNVHNKAIYLIQGSRELPFFITDATGELVVHTK